jgi:hypothetical protein
MARAVLPAALALLALGLFAGGVLAEPAPLPERAVDLIIAHEIGSPALYQRRYRRPLWPGAHSGVTVGVGYDLGHRRAVVIAKDWQLHPQAPRLASAAGVIGPPARELARTMDDVEVDWPFALQVFERTSLVEHHRIARRVFGPRHFDRLPGLAQGALVSLVYNRGGAMTGPARAEMRAIRDDCLPRDDLPCIADQLRAMLRLWIGSDIERGMRKRRGDEAELVLLAAAGHR